MKLKRYTIQVFIFNSEKEVHSICTLKTKPITKERCLAICKDEVKSSKGKACFMIKDRRV